MDKFCEMYCKYIFILVRIFSCFFSSPLVDPCKLHFVFNVVVFPESQGRSKQREGVCTGWLSHMAQTNEENTNNSLAGEISKLSIHSAPNVSTEV